MFTVLNFFTSSLLSASNGFTLSAFLLCMAAALVIGLIQALVYAYKTTCTRSFLTTLALLPAVVAVVIMMVSGSLGASVAVAGTFSLVRFRSVPGTAKEICAIFLAMAAGLAVGMGYVGFAALFAVLMAAMCLLYSRCPFGAGRQTPLEKDLRITIPEDLDYSGAFDDLFASHTAAWKLISVKTSNLGSLYKLTYQLTLRSAEDEKALIDQLRCRNGNLEISSSLHADELRDL